MAEARKLNVVHFQNIKQPAGSHKNFSMSSSFMMIADKPLYLGTGYTRMVGRQS